MDIITRLEATRDQTLKCFALNDDQLARSYGPGKWPVRFILHHLADGETVLYDRIRRVISEPKQVLWAFDQTAWAKGLDYAQAPLNLACRIYEAVRAGVIYQARVHYEKSGHLTQRTALGTDQNCTHIAEPDSISPKLRHQESDGLAAVIW